MITLVFKADPTAAEYPHDVEKIQSLLASMGFSISFISAQMAWQEYSTRMCAGWMIVHDDAKEVYENIRPYVQEVL